MGRKVQGKKVLLLHAPFKALAFGKKWQGNKVLSPPLGLLYLASPLIHEGYNVSLIDLNVDRFTLEEFKQIVRNQDLILITCYTANMDNITKIIQNIKDWNEQAFILCGGPHCNNIQEYIEGSYITCVGEAEGYIAKICNSIILQKSLEDIPGLIYMKNGKVIKHPGVMIVDNLDSSMLPARELADRKKYGYVGKVRVDIAFIISTRGCNHNCHFCCRRLDIKYRERSVEKVINEIKDLIKQGYKYIDFGDDNFLLNRKRVNQIMDKIIQERIQVKIGLQGRVDAVDISLLKKMRQAGVVLIQFGIESANQDILDFYNKKTTVEKGIEAIRLVNKVGILTYGYFMIGAPFETKLHIEKNKEYFDSVPLDLMMCGILTYVRGSQLWQNAYSRSVIRKDELIVQANRRLSNYSYEELNLIKDDLTKHFLKNLRRLLRIQYKILRYGELRIFLKQIFIVKNLIRKTRGFETW